MVIFSAPSRGQQVLTLLGSEQTTSLLVVMIKPHAHAVLFVFGSFIFNDKMTCVIHNFCVIIANKFPE